jgi:hypothetical protein
MVSIHQRLQAQYFAAAIRMSNYLEYNGRFKNALRKDDQPSAIKPYFLLSENQLHKRESFGPNL